MKREKLYEAIGDVDENYVSEAHAMSKKNRSVLIKWLATAACLCLVVGVAIRIGIGFVPSQMTDIYREGNLIEIAQESELPANYDGKLLAFDLGFDR